MILVAPYVGAWIETIVYNHLREQVLSHPTWVRGLKQTLSLVKMLCCVAPYVGAWIETFRTSAPWFLAAVAPYVGAWIETFSKI